MQQQSFTGTVEGKCYCFIHHIGLYFCFNSFVFVCFQRVFLFCLCLVTKLSFSFLGSLSFVMRALAKCTTGWKGSEDPIKQQKVTVMTHMVPDVVGTMGMSSASVGMDQGI